MTNTGDKDHYAVLGIARDAPPEVVRAAFRVLVQKYHPDRNASADANCRAEEINAAYSVLKDPQIRAEYDRTLGAIGVPPATPETGDLNSANCSNNAAVAARIRRTVGGTVYEMTFQDGIVREHTEWTESIQTLKSDHRLFVGAGKRLVTELKSRQRLWLRLGVDDQLLERTGDWLPVAVGQPITLVSIYQPERSRAADPVVLVNRATGRWFTLKTPGAVAKELLSNLDSLKQMARLLAVWSATLAVLYFTIMRDAAVLTWALALVFGVPSLFAVTATLTQQETRRLERDIRHTLSTAGMP